MSHFEIDQMKLNFLWQTIFVSYILAGILTDFLISYNYLNQFNFS